MSKLQLVIAVHAILNMWIWNFSCDVKISSVKFSLLFYLAASFTFVERWAQYPQLILPPFDIQIKNIPSAETITILSKAASITSW